MPVPAEQRSEQHGDACRRQSHAPSAALPSALSSRLGHCHCETGHGLHDRLGEKKSKNNQDHSNSIIIFHQHFFERFSGNTEVVVVRLAALKHTTVRLQRTLPRGQRQLHQSTKQLFFSWSWNKSKPTPCFTDLLTLCLDEN